MMDVGDPPGERVLDRDHAEIGLARGDRLEAILEGRLRNRLAIGKHFEAGDVRIGTGFALKDHTLASQSHSLQSVPARMARARARSAGVSTPNGTSSMIDTSIRMPASSALNCSSFSRISSTLGGRATKRSSAARR